MNLTLAPRQALEPKSNKPVEISSTPSINTLSRIETYEQIPAFAEKHGFDVKLGFVGMQRTRT